MKPDQALDRVEAVLAGAGGVCDAAEATVVAEARALTRIADNTIHQNVVQRDVAVTVRTFSDGRVGIATTNDLQNLGGLAKRAAEASALLPQNPDAVLPERSPHAQRLEQSVYEDPRAANCPPDVRADAALEMISACARENAKASGFVETEGVVTAVGNTAGTRQSHSESRVGLSLTATTGAGGAGFAQGFGRRVGDLDPRGAAAVALDKARRSEDAAAFPPGEHVVILEPAATADFLLFLAFLGFGAHTLAQHRSWMKIGEKLAGPVGVWADPFDPRLADAPFDYEGVPRERVPLIEGGVCLGVVSDRSWARRAGVPDTGYALPLDNAFGPYPKCLRMEASGAGTLDELIAKTPEALLVTHFWYTNYVNPMRTLVTGTTRDGTFRVKDGSVVEPVADLRYMTSMLDAFAAIDAATADLTLVVKYGVRMLVPAVRTKMTFVAE